MKKLISLYFFLFSGFLLAMEKSAAEHHDEETIELVSQEIDGFDGKKEFVLAFPFKALTLEDKKNATFIPQNAAVIFDTNKYKDAIMVSGPFSPCIAIIIKIDHLILYAHWGVQQDLKSLNALVEILLEQVGTSKTLQAEVTLFSKEADPESEEEYYKSCYFAKNQKELMDRIKETIQKSIHGSLRIRSRIFHTETKGTELGDYSDAMATIAVNARGEIFHTSLYAADFFDLNKTARPLALVDLPSIIQRSAYEAKISSINKMNKLVAIAQANNVALIASMQYVAAFCEKVFKWNATEPLTAMLIPVGFKLVFRDGRIAASSHIFCCNIKCPKRGENPAMPGCIIYDEGLLRCSACQKISYCSTACQRADWRLHRLECNKGPKKKPK